VSTHRLYLTVSSMVADLTSIDHDHNTAKPNSQPNTTPTAQSSKNANCSSRIYSPAPPPQLPHIAKGNSNRVFQKVKSSPRPLQTSQLHCAGHTS
jgi:hypothetical protein